MLPGATRRRRSRVALRVAVAVLVARAPALLAQPTPAAGVPGRLAYCRAAEGRRQLVWRDLSSGVERVLGPGASDAEPVWSPGGRWLALRVLDDQGRWRLALLDASATRKGPVWLPTQGDSFSPCWSPAGDTLVWSEEQPSGPPRLVALPLGFDPDTGAVTPGKRIELGSGEQPRFSSDGSLLAAVLDGAERDALRVAEWPGGQWTTWLESSALGDICWRPGWPSLVAALRDEQGDWRVGLVDGPGQPIRFLSAGPRDAAPSISPDGRTLAFVRGNPRSLDLPDEQLILRPLAVDGRPTQAAPSDPDAPDLSAGQALAEPVERSLPLPRGAGGGLSVGRPVFSPDGRLLALTLADEGQPFSSRRLVLLELASGRVTPVGPDCAWPAFAALR